MTLRNELEATDEVELAHEEGRVSKLGALALYRDGFARHLRPVGDFIGIPNDQRFVITRESASYHAHTANVVCAKDWLMR